MDSCQINHLASENLYILGMYEKLLYTYIYMLFTGQEVRIGKNCARGLETEGTAVVPNTDRPRPVNNNFIYF